MSAHHLLRKAAIEKMQSPEQLDMAMRVTSPVSWLALTTLGVLISTAVVYSVVATMPVRVDGQGIILRGGVAPKIQVLAAGVVRTIEVEVGDVVEKDQVVAYLDLADLQSQIQQAQDAVRDLERQESNRRGGLGNVMGGYRAEIANLQAQKVNKQKLLQQGLARQQDVLAIDRQIQQVRTQMFQAQQQDTGVSNQLDERRRSLQQLQDKMENGAVIRSNYRGRVAAIVKLPGQVVQASEALINLEEADAPFEVTLFVPFAEGKKIHPSMEVRISPDTVKREEFGFMLGSVQAVSPQPVTYDEVVAKLGRDLAQKYVKDTPFEVRVIPTIDETTGRFRWTSGDGPPSEVSASTGVTAQIIVDYKKPISYVIPTIKKTLGVSS
ncbi:MAG TPA: NHLP bacteriocin system secretion protein [Thermoanaerobaculia bacterium]|nr:NHLP bacteriocin system secretion protein [Thermoanaerobaculia bacterium]